ncbi:Threonine/homoserine efflux transporter RhtA [Malonomonas rubra DSM 5091]|uniref:Threonine/homoserine efflux transporter RhtA n=1 Tax=Malonomonas rubra DSM 5091 TaxID=1122189 RepID=A0A1M6K1G7_MALRU|nr:DMT family transporter [Malonomonas rubra]SHJ52767.1 Threonine/homoserine efflux transporter RhtA [Malonomonas rubra DSM 5091]
MISTYIRLYLVAFFWGGTFVAGRSLSGVVDPVSAAFFRFAIASLLLLAITITRESLQRIDVKQLLVVIALGASGILAYNLFFFNGLTLIAAGRASLIIALNPVFITIASALIYREPLPKRRILGIFLSLSGAIIVITRGQPLTVFDSGIGRGELLIFGCVISWTLYSIIGKTAMKGLSPLVSVCYSSIAGTILLFCAMLLQGDLAAVVNYPPKALIALLYLGMFGTVIGFLWYFQGIQIIGASRAAVFINFVPVNGVLLATLILGEPLTFSLLTGGALVVTGSYLANSTPRKS